MVNVPTGVWVDEEGRIVRPPEVAYTKASRVMGQQVGHKNYVPGLRDWVEKGADSVFAMSPEQIEKKLAALSPERAEADAAVELTVYLHSKGKTAEAKKHWQRAQKLDPDNWNYHRQAWSFESGAGQKWFRKVMQNQGKPYYRPLELPDPKDKKPARKPVKKTAPPKKAEDKPAGEKKKDDKKRYF